MVNRWYIRGVSEMVKRRLITRLTQAKLLRKQGLKVREVAETMGITFHTAAVYIYTKPDSYTKTRAKIKRQKTQKHVTNIREVIRKELFNFSLPMEWEDEVMKLYLAYRLSKSGFKGCGRPDIDKLDIDSLLVLMCRRYRIPTPRKLEKLTYQGHGARKKASGYMDVLKVINGVTYANPIDYIKFFVRRESLSNSIVAKAELLINSIPKFVKMGKNPRVVAGAVLYEIYKPTSSTEQKNRIYTQRYIADQLQVTEVSLRNFWVKFFKA